MSVSYSLCLLAGGQARRMGGGDKGEIDVGGKTLITSLIERYALAPYMMLNANGDVGRFAHYGLDIIADILPDYQGPLAGIYTALSHIKTHRPQDSYVAILPTDAPLLPDTLIQDMIAAAISHDAPLVSVKSHGRRHPVIGLWSLSVFEALEKAVCEEGVRKIDAFTTPLNCHYISYDEDPDPFLNLNRPDDVTAYLNAIGEEG